MADLKTSIQKAQAHITASQWLDALRNNPATNQVQDLNLASDYLLLPQSVWEQYGEWTNIKNEPYITPYHVCWAFALETMAELTRQFGINGCCLIMDYPGQHAYNLLGVADEDSPRDPYTGEIDVMVWEPQEGAFVPPEKVGTAPYDLAQGTVAIV